MMQEKVMKTYKLSAQERNDLVDALLDAHDDLLSKLEVERDFGPEDEIEAGIKLGRWNDLVTKLL